MSAAVAPPTSPGHLAIRPDWLALHAEEVLEPDLPIVDPHHHLWDRAGNRYLFQDLRDDLETGHAIRATVFVQCRAMHHPDGPEPLRPVGETEFVLGTAAQFASGLYGPVRACAGIVGHADLMLGDAVGAVLDEHLRVAGPRFKGIRYITAWDPDPSLGTTAVRPGPGVMAEPAFRAGFAQLARRGLSFDAWLLHPQLPELAELARAFADTTIILDHCGGPIGIGPYAGRRDAVLADWRRDLRAVATCPNVLCKLGGLGMHVIGLGHHARPAPPTSEELAAAWRPYMETCIEAFGPERCMFESNFPVDKGSYAYPVFWNACKRLTFGASAAEKAALFHGTATRAYRLDPTT